MPVTISFRIGRQNKTRINPQQGVIWFMDALDRDLKEQIADNLSVNVRQLEKRLPSLVDRSIKQAMRFAVQNMVGLPSQVSQNKGSPTRIVFNWAKDELPWINSNRKVTDDQSEITWRPLSFDTIQKKMAGKKGNRSGSARAQAMQYYVHTGKLRRELQALAKNITTKTGTVRIGYKANPEALKFNSYRGSAHSVKVGSLQLSFLPQLNFQHLPKVVSLGEVNDMLFERSLGISSESIKKLKGIDHYHRPLLQPVFTYWALNRIPNMVSGAMSSAIMTERIRE